MSGVTTRRHRSARGSRRTSAANTARSAQSNRGRGLVRRKTATSWRSTRSSTSLAEEVRPSSRTSPSTCRKIKYSRRSDTPGSCPTSDHRWSATPGPTSGTPPPDAVHRARPQERRRRRPLGRDRRAQRPGLRSAVVEDAVIVLRALVEHRDDVVHTRTQTVNRLHVLLTQLLPGGAPRQLDADTAARLLRTVRPRASGPRTLRRLAAELVTEIRHLDRRIATATTDISHRRRRQRHHPDPAARHRRSDRREDPGPGRGHHPVPVRGSVRLLHRHRADRGLLRRRRAPPTLPGRGPPAQLLPAHHGPHPNPARQPRPGLLPAQTRSGQRATKKRCAA